MDTNLERREEEEEEEEEEEITKALTRAMPTLKIQNYICDIFPFALARLKLSVSLN
jgi:hypothetical protein